MKQILSTEFSEKAKTTGTLILNFQPLDLLESNFCSSSHPSVIFLLWQPKQMNTVQLESFYADKWDYFLHRAQHMFLMTVVIVLIISKNDLFLTDQVALQDFSIILNWT